ncbi:alpha/beta hydrolase [Shimia sp. R9_1]|uniref:alpha/beta hydrolase family protein n=1 Tax=Shimia sp. R9_1 TaxID=2821111 RepID=UPI001ADBDCD5|nr:alpha/beta hydrolase [Shimia sp. R9_1]MBO9407848.1 alpha/beta hydrolase [Shimia sp. R9_1]
MFGKVISNMMVKPGQSPLFDSPDAYGLDYEDVAFQTEDGVTLRGWLIHGGSDKVIVQTHFGVQCNRGGWTPKGHGPITPWKQDIKFLRQAEYLMEQGYSVLMYDMRGHGESDLGPIPWVSWGPEEAKDVIGAVDFVSARFPEASIGLLSICMGSASTTYAYGRDNGLAERKNVKAMIAVQPLLYTCFMKALGMPNFMVKAGEKVSEQRLGFDMGQPNFVKEAHNVTVPTLVVQNKNDPWTQLGMVEDYYQALTVEKDMRMLDIEKSRFAAYDYVGSHPEELMGWFDRYM